MTRTVEAAPSSALRSYDRPAQYAMGKDTDQVITMADGVRLRADVYYPTDKGTGQRAAGSFPVLLQQTVYGKQLIQISGNFDPVNSGFLAPLGQFLGPLIGDVVGSISDTQRPDLLGGHGLSVFKTHKPCGQRSSTAANPARSGRASSTSRPRFVAVRARREII